MKTVSGLFDTWADATAAPQRAQGSRHQVGRHQPHRQFPADLTPEENVVGKDTAAAARSRRDPRRAGGLRRPWRLAIPGLGPVIAGGWLFATLIGAVAGASIGAVGRRPRRPSHRRRHPQVRRARLCRRHPPRRGPAQRPRLARRRGDRHPAPRRRRRRRPRRPPPAIRSRRLDPTDAQPPTATDTVTRFPTVPPVI